MITGCQPEPGGVNHNLAENCSLARSSSSCCPSPPEKNQKVTRRMTPRIGGCESFGEGEGAWKLHRNLFKSQFSLILPSQDAHLTHTPHLHPIPTYMPTHCSSNTPYFCSSNSFFILLILTWHSPRI